MTRRSSYHQAVQGIDFLSTYQVERDGLIKIKLLALHHFQAMTSIKQISAMVMYSEKTVLSWIKNFVEFDYEGLIERAGRGRKPRLSPYDEEKFKLDLDVLQEQRSGGTITANEIREFLADNFDCCYGLSGVYALLDRNWSGMDTRTLQASQTKTRSDRGL